LRLVLIKHALNNRANSCFISQNVENNLCRFCSMAYYSQL